MARFWPEPLPAFNDLTTRAVTGIALAVVGFGAVWLGGAAFLGLVAIAMAGMVWEAARLLGLSRAILALGALAAVSLYGAVTLEHPFAIALLAFPSLWAVFMSAGKGAQLSVPVLLGLMLAGYVAVVLRDGGGVIWILWLILTVVVTDIAGYFAGRAIGGKKFWPSISPKKTWAGVLAGWLAAGVVGAFFMPLTGTGEGLILVSMALSFASQMGDIAESALKRRAGVKDSSNLLPGHGGILDRLDGVIGALLVTGAVAALTNYPEAPI